MLNRDKFLNILVVGFIATWAAMLAWFLFSPVSMGESDKWYTSFNIPDLFSKVRNQRAYIDLMILFIGAMLVAVCFAKRWIKPKYAWPLILIISLFVVRHYVFPLAFCAWFFLLSSAMGLFILRSAWVVRRDEEKIYPISLFAIGLLEVVAEVFLLSQFNALSFKPIIALLIIKTILLRKHMVAVVQDIYEQRSLLKSIQRDPVSCVFVSLALVYVFVSFTYALKPPYDYDVLAQHLAFPRMFSRLGRYPFLFNLNFGENSYITAPNLWLAYPANIEVIFSYLYPFGQFLLCQIFQVMCFALTLICILKLGNAAFSMRVGAVTAALFASIPLFNMLGASTFVEIDSALFTIISVCHLFLYIKDRKTLHLWMIGFVSGMNVGTKLQGVIVFGIIMMVLFIHEIIYTRKLSSLIRAMVIPGLLVLVTTAPWFTRNYVLFHDPVYPLFRPPNPHQNHFFDNSVNPQFSYYFNYPFDVFFFVNPRAIMYHWDGPYSRMGFVLFLLLPFSIYVLRKLNRNLSYLTFISIMFVLASAFACQTRYSLPFYTVITMFIGAGVVGARKYMARPVMTLIHAVLCIAIMTNILFFRSWFNQTMPSDLLLKAADEKAFYANRDDAKCAVPLAVNKYIKSPSDKVVEIGLTLVPPYLCDGLWYNPNCENLWYDPRKVGNRIEMMGMLAACQKNASGAHDRFLQYLVNNKIKVLVVPYTYFSHYHFDALMAHPQVSILEDIKKYNVYLLGIDPTRTSVPRQTTSIAAADLKITEWGPKHTVAGSPFNLQANGESTFYFVLNRVSPEMAVFLANVELPSPTINARKNVLSVSVPRILINHPGRFLIHVKDKKTGQKSQQVLFKIEPRATKTGAK